MHEYSFLKKILAIFYTRTTIFLNKMGNQVLTTPYIQNQNISNSTQNSQASSNDKAHNAHVHFSPDHPYTAHSVPHNHPKMNAAAAKAMGADIPPECPMHAKNANNKENTPPHQAKSTNNAQQALVMTGECPIKHENDINPNNMV